jgi:hypothetical protein
MSFDEYIENCRKIVDKLGKYSVDYDQMYFKDEIMEIVTSKISNAILVRSLNDYAAIVCVRSNGFPYYVNKKMWKLEDHILNIIKHL